MSHVTPLLARPLGKRGFFWRQMATQGKRRTWTLGTVLRYPLLKWLYRRKKTWSHVAPVLVVGQNPWLNALAVWRLSFTHSEVWVWDVEGLDWWNYNFLHTPTFLSACKKWFPYLQFDRLADVLLWVKSQACAQAKVYALRGGFAPHEVFRDKHSGGWVLKLTPGVWPSMEGVLKAEETRRQSKQQLQSFWREARYATWPKQCVMNDDDEVPCHYLLAKRVIWSSLPPRGVAVVSTLTPTFRTFAFEGGETMGCASQIAQIPESFFQHPLDETNELMHRFPAI
jgi:hypothetical protein